MKIYNVMTRTKQDFVPIEKGKVSIYACGITVNGTAHIGHGRQAIVFNSIVEYLRLRGYQVTYVRNYTDTDDRLIAQAKELGIHPLTLADERVATTDNTIARIVTRDADIKPRVSQHMKGIIDFVSDLIDKGNAYVSGGDVYFDVASYPNYGRLSNRSTKDMLEGVRIDVNDNKHTPLDFALWKGVAQEEFGFDSPWGKGRPGWHIECSSMINELLGKHIDIHGGGKDLIFPHHENEIAQSCCHNDCQLANYWIHNGLVTVDGVKMSKSMGNFVTIEQLLSQYDSEVIRLLILSTHYSSPLEINTNALVTAEKHLYEWYSVLDSLRIMYKDQPAIDVEKSPLYQQFVSSMDNDFNVSLFIAQLYAVFSNVVKAKGDNKKQLATELLTVVDKVYPVLGLFNQPVGQYVNSIKQKYIQQLNLDVQLIDSIISDRSKAKADKNYQLADSLRSQLLEMGVSIKDTVNGTTWDIDFGNIK